MSGTDLRHTAARAVKRRFAGVSWQSPLIKRAMPALDLADRRMRARHGLDGLPPYSIRVRGTGMSGELGGLKYVLTGTDLTDSLVRYAGLSADSKVLDIGCGAGRVAYSLTKLLEPGNYRGIDVDQVSVDACRGNAVLRAAGCEFEHADLDSDLYNKGDDRASAATFRFPYADDSFDIVYLESVFTHLTDDECAHYAQEILRMLRPGGRAVVSGFIRDLGTGTSAFTFSHAIGDVYVEYPDNPRKAVAADAATFEKWFGRARTTLLRGNWRGDEPDFGNGQDWLVFTK